MKFEWNESKNLLNKQKHHISFETATHIFEDPYYIELYDFEHSEDEDRYIAIGKFRNVLFVVFTEKRESIRIISARAATNAERSLYYDQDIFY
ncbi:MAG: BrnT family toxin [Lachnospiraceae bacterium]|nr:BrnT family toxin [Lachnospiraceae bacterium]